MAICVGPPDKISAGSSGVLINGKPAARLGDSSAHGGKIVAGCPTVLIGDGGGGAGLNTPVPDKPSDAPTAIVLSSSMNNAYKSLWNQSFPKGNAQECGGTLVQGSVGNVQLVNQGKGTSGSFPPNRNVQKDQEIIGVFHTHPYDKSEGSYTNISLSGGDAGYMINQGDKIMIAQSGDGQFMYLRSRQTPKNVDAVKLNNDQNTRMSELMRNGKSFEEASQISAKETAVKYKMAYYEGKNGQFTRVSP